MDPEQLYQKAKTHHTKCDGDLKNQPLQFYQFYDFIYDHIKQALN